MPTEDERKLELLEASLMLNRKDPHKWLWLGRQQRKMARLEDARKSYDRALGIDPRFSDAHYELALVEADVENETAAEAGFAKAIECNEKHFGAHDELATRREAKSDWAGAARHLEAMALAKPEDVATSRRTARVLVRLGRFPAATIHLERAVAVAPNDTDARGDLARCRAAQGEWQATIDCLAGIPLDALQVDALLALGKAHEELGGAAPAIQAYEAVFEKDAENLEAVVGLGRTCLRLHDYARARVMFARAVEKEPERASLHALHAEALQGLGEFEAALARAERGIAADATSAASHERAGLALNALRRFDDAVSAFGRAVRYDAGRLRSLVGLAEAHERLNQGERAVLALEAAIALSPKDATLRERSGDLLYRLGHTARALSAFRDAVALDATLPGAHRGIGRCAVDLERFADAIDALRQAVELDASDVAALRLLGTAERALGRATAAAESFERATRVDPKDAETWQQLGASLLEAKRLGPALDALERSLALDASDATSRLVATALVEARRFEDAVPVLERVVERAPDDAAWLRELGRAFWELGRGEAAQEALGKAARLRRTEASYFEEHGQVCLALRDFDTAVESLERARGLDPNDATTVALGQAYIGKQRFADAVSVLESVVAREPKLVAAQRAFGRALAALGRLPEAKARLQAAVALENDDAPTQHELGLVLMRLGQLDLAVVHLEQATALAPDLTEALRALARALGTLGKHQDASIRYRQLLRNHPDDESALLELADTNEALGRDEEALGFLEQAFALRAEPVTRRRIGLLQARLGRDRHAAETLGAVLGNDPSEFTAYGVLATSEQRLQNTEAAIRALSTGARLAEKAGSPEAPAYYRRLGFALADAEREPPAIDALTRAIALGDRDAQTGSRLAALHRSSGERAFEDREFASAATHFERAMDGEFDAELCRKLATARLELGRKDDAVLLLKRGLGAFPKDARLASFLGRTLLELGDPDGASGAFSAALAQEPRAFDELWLAAEAAARLGKRRDAIELLVRARDVRPTAPEVAEQLGRHYYEEGRLQEALAAWERVLEQRPLDARASYEAGRCQRDLGNDELAASSFGRALVQSPDDPRANYELGAARARLGQFQAAIGPLEKALELDSGLDQARELLGRSLAKVERDAEAADVLGRCLDARFDVELALERARCLLRIERFIELERAADRVLATAPGHGEALQLRARALEAQGRNDEALKALRLAASDKSDLRAERELVSHLLGRAEAHTSARDSHAAASAYREALALVPNDVEIHTKLARALRASGQLQPALDAARAGLAVDGKRVELWVLSAELLAMGSVLDDAVTAYRSALDLAPDHAQAWLGLAEALERKGDLEAADQALASASGLEEPKEALRRRRKLLERLARREDLAEVLVRLRVEGDLDGEGERQLAELQHDLGRPLEVARSAEAALATLVDDPRCLYLLGRARGALGEHILAQRSLGRLVELDPEHRDAWALLARTELALGASDRAVPSLERALQFFPDDVELWAGLADALARLGRQEEEARALTALVALSPSLDRHRRLGLLLDDLGAADAETQLEAVARELPHDVEVARRLGALLLARAEQAARARDSATAIVLLERATPHLHDDARLSFRIASELRGFGRLDAALAVASRVVELSPSDVPALTLEGQLRRETGAAEGAVQSFRRAVEIEADAVPALFGMGMALLELSKPADAEAALRRAVTIAPEERAMWSLLTKALERQGKREEACDSQWRVVRLEPRDADEQLRLGDLLMRANRFADSVDVLARLFDPTAVRCDVALSYSESLYQVDRLRDAVDVATQALERGRPTEVQEAALWHVRATALEELDEADSAIEAYERAHALGRSEVRERFGRILRRRAREVAEEAPERAASLLGRALELGSRDATTLVELGRARRAAGELQGALDAVREALAQEPQSFPAHLSLAELEAALGRHELAVAAFDAALAIRPDSAEAWLGAGLSKLALAAPDAVSAFERSIAIRPTRDALGKLASYHRERGDEAATLSALDRLLRLGPLPSQVAAELALLRIAHGRANEGLLLVEDALASAPNDPNLLLAKGGAAAATGQPEIARDAYEALLALNPDHEAANGLLGRLSIELGDAKRAVVALERQVLLTPTTECLEQLADALGRAGEEERQREVLGRLSRAFHEDSDGLRRIAEQHRASGRLDEAISVLERALELQPTEPATGSELGRLLVAQARRSQEQGNTQKALALLVRAERFAAEPGQCRLVAELYSELGELAPARRVAGAWLAQEPKNHEALTLLGKLSLSAGEAGPALEYFERALDVDADFLPALRGAGFLLAQRQESRAAAEKLLRAIRLDPSARDVSTAAVQCLARVQEAEVSERLLRELVQLLPNDPSAHRELAIVLGRRDSVADGLDQVERALSLDSADAAGWIAKANLLLQAGRPKEAMFAATRALELAPLQAEALRALGLARAQSGEAREALEPLEAAYKEQPSEELALRLARLHAQKGGEESLSGAHDLAIRSLSRALELGDVADATRIALGRSFAALGQSQKVVDALRENLAPTRDCLPGWLLLGEAYARSEQWQNAAQTFDVALGIHGESFEALLGRARTAVGLGDHTLAAAHLETALRVRPTDAAARREALRHYERVRDSDAVLRHLEALGEPDALENDELKRLGVLLAERQRDVEAERVLERALARGIADVVTLDAITLVKARRDPKSAVEFASRLVELDAAHLDGWVRLARGSLATGDVEGAERAYQRAIALDPKKELLAELATLQTAAPEAEPRIETLRRLVERYPHDAEHTAALGLELERAGKSDAAPMLARALDLGTANPEVRGALYRLIIDEASRHFAAGQPGKALESTSRARALLPDATLARMRAAEFLEALGQLDHAVDALRGVLALDAGHVRALTRLGAIEVAKGEYLAAIPRLRRAAELDTKDTESLRHLADAESGLQHADAAMQALERLLERDPSDLSAKRHLIRLAIDQGLNARALDLCREALESAPSDVPLELERARTLYALQRKDEAIEALERVVAIEADNLVAWKLLVEYLREKGAPEPLAAALKQLFRLEKTPTTLLELERCAEELRQPELLSWSLEQLTVLVPNDAKAFARWAEALDAGGRVNEAIQKLDRALAIDPKTAWLRETMVRVCWTAARQKRAEHDHQSAVEYYERAVRHEAGSPALHYEYADSLRRTKSPRASEAMKAALRTAIANPSAGKITLPDVGAALFEMQDYPAAVQAYHLACQHRPDELDLQRALIAALLHAGRRAEAVDWMRHALRFAPRDESLLYSLGMQCVALGRMNEVRDVWTALAPLNPALAQQLWTASTTGR